MVNRSNLKRTDVITQSAGNEVIAPVLLKVLKEFSDRNISYCYWKSRRRIYEVLAGSGDVDLLISRNDQHRAHAILLKQGFKLFPSVPAQDHPAVLSFLGYDERSGRLIHIHAHFRLIVGARLVKNYQLPWEDLILSRAIAHPQLPLRLLDPTTEALILVLRACLEWTWWDHITNRNWRATIRKFQRDRQELVAIVERDRFRDLVVKLLSADLVDLTLDALYGARPLERQSQLRRRMKEYCSCYRCYNAVELRMRTIGRAMLWVAGNVNKRFLYAPRPWNRRVPGGGCVVAIVGVDGSGKSTSVSAMREWLSVKIDVVPIYFGTGDGRPSLLLRPLKLIAPLVTRMMKSKPNCASHGKISGATPGMLYSVLLMIWAVAVALDKRKKLVDAQRGSHRGLFVLTDRYPQNEIVGFNDGPLLPRLTTVPRWLRRFEETTYARAGKMKPDLVIKLMVNPETAAEREPTMDPVVIRNRIAALQRIEFAGARIVRVDAEQPLTEVLRVVRHEIWNLL
jgi:hypothetical protein